MRAMFWKSSFQSGLGAPASGDLHGGARGRRASPARRSASSSVCACEAASFGRPAAIAEREVGEQAAAARRHARRCPWRSPSPRSAMPASSRARAARLMLWWQTGQLATRIAASTPSAWQRATTSGQSTSSVDAVAAVGGQAVEARRKRADAAAPGGAPQLRQREPGAAVLGRRVLAVDADVRDAQVVVRAPCRPNRPRRTSPPRCRARRAPGRPCRAGRAPPW